MKQAKAEELELRLERVIPASREQVFAAWTDPELLKRWYCPEGARIAEVEADARPGEAWHVVMVGEDGTRFHGYGRYVEVAPPGRVVFTHRWREAEGSSPETTVTVELVAEGPSSTRVVLTQTGFAATASRDGHLEGWESTVGRLEAYFRSEGVRR